MRFAFAGVSLALLSLIVAGCSRESPKGGPDANKRGTSVSTAPPGNMPPSTNPPAGGTTKTETTKETTITTPGSGTDTTRDTTRDTNKGTTTRAGDNSFAIKEPRSVNVNQGDMTSQTISLDRGSAFDQTVKITVKPDTGIKVDPDTVEIKKGNNDATINISAEPDATVGTHSIDIRATPATGEPTSIKMAVNVREKKK